MKYVVYITAFIVGIAILVILGIMEFKMKYEVYGDKYLLYLAFALIASILGVAVLLLTKDK